MSEVTSYWCERAWCGPGDIVDGLIVDVVDTHISALRQSDRPSGARPLPGLTIPGFADCHSHVFHRALRGRTQHAQGTFWSWRDVMYDVAARLDPDTLWALAHATYREMALAGITAVGEFHYLHHGPDGVPYEDPNALGRVVVDAARQAGLRIALLDTCYLSSGFGARPVGVQRRFADADVDAWGARVERLADISDPGVVVGAAIHSVRAVPRVALGAVAKLRPTAPLHVHLSEQVAENDACRDHYGVSPTRLLADEDVLSDRLTAVHATHLSSDDIAALGEVHCFVDFCPTTERDLADGIGPSSRLRAAGAVLTLGSDSHAVIDMHEEMRAVELNERLSSGQRGHWQPAELLTAATLDGHRSLGFPDAGRIKVGCWADLVSVDLASPRTAGSDDGEAGVVFAASATDITSVVASGRLVERDPENVGSLLLRAVADLWRDR